jgi:hypothetical protein
MKSNLTVGAAVVIVVAATFLGGGTASATRHSLRSMYYPWVGFPFDRPGTVNPDVISGPLLSTSTHWPTLTDYGFYRPTFVPGLYHACRRRACPVRARW